MPSKKPTRATTPVPPAKSAGLKHAIGPTGMFIAAGLVMAGGILVAARQQSQPVLSATPRLESVPMPNAPSKSMEALNAHSGAAAPGASASSSSPEAKVQNVTLAGCLERDGDGFQLKDVSGASAPKARSWKSGFLKKGTPTVDVVDASHALRLADQVGKRVGVSGALADRELKARSLHRVAATCK
jgi:hypothetical protein